MAEEKHITVEEEGLVLAQATVSVSEVSLEAMAQVHVAPGHLPVGTRQRMADRVHEAVTEDNAEHLTATLPLGDVELVQGIREHLSNVELRAAGATSILRGDVKPG